MSSYEILVEVRRAQNLVSKKLIESPATYVKVCVDDQCEKTESIKDLENPVWNSSFRFTVSHIPQRILFEVKDDRAILPDAKLGNYSIDMDQITTSNMNSSIILIDGEVPLMHAKHGSLDVRVLMQPAGYSENKSINNKPKDSTMSDAHNAINTADKTALSSDNTHKKGSTYDKDYESKASNLNTDKTQTHRYKDNEHDKDYENRSSNLNTDKTHSHKEYDKDYESKANQYLNTDKNSRQNMARQYFDRAHGSKSNNLVVTVVEASGFKKADFFSKSDPYVEVLVGDRKETTKTAKNRQNASWNETFVFPITKDSIPNIEFHIKDDDVFFDDNMGKGVLSSDKLSSLSEKEREFNVPLAFKGQENGALHIKIRYEGNIDNNVNNMGMSSSSNYQNRPNNTDNSSFDKMGSYQNNNMGYSGAEDWTVTVVDAEGIKKGDLFTKSDPYIIIRFGGKTQKTQVSNKSKNHPVWNETFVFPGQSNFSDMEIQLLDDDLVKDDQMGQGFITKNELMSAPTSDKDYNVPLKYKGKEAGFVHLRIRRSGGDNMRSSAMNNNMHNMNNNMYNNNNNMYNNNNNMYNNNNNMNNNMHNMNNMNNMNNNMHNMHNMGNTYGNNMNTYNNNNNGAEHWSVTIVDAQGVKESDLLTKTDPYVIIRFDNRTEKTKVSKCKDKGHPVWNETFEFSTNNNSFSDMEIQLMDDDFFKDDKMGAAYIRKQDLINMSSLEKDFTIPLTYKNKEAGILRMRVNRRGTNNMGAHNMGAHNMGTQNMGTQNMGMHNMGMNSNNMNNNSHQYNNMGSNEYGSNFYQNQNQSQNSNQIEQWQVTIVDAEGTKKSDLFSKSDPYVTIKFGGRTEKTKVSKNKEASRPIWNESFTFPVRLNEMENMEIRLMDDDLLKDDTMGTCYINKNELMNLSSSERDFNLPLTYKNKEAGILRLKIKRSGENMMMRNNNNMMGTGMTTNTQQYQPIDRLQFETEPSLLHKQPIIHDNREDEKMYASSDKNEYHVLPPIHVKERPTIVEREIEYEKPIEVHNTIIHREKPIIIEKPIIKETHEHYRDATEYIRRDENIVTEKIDSSYNMPNTNEQAILSNLKQQRLSQYQNTSPIVHNEKQHIKLDTIVKDNPSQIYEKQVVYEQPIEIEKKHIEHVVPRVHENILIEKEHVHEKLQPQVIQDNVQKRYDGDSYYANQGHSSSFYDNNNNNNNNRYGSQASSSSSTFYDNAHGSQANYMHNQQHGGMNQQSQYDREEIHFFVVDAQGLGKGDIISKADPYVVINAYGNTYKTKPVKNSNNPIWNQNLIVPIDNSSHNQKSDIEILLMDDDILKDDQMGRSVLKYNQLLIPYNQEQEFNVPLTFKGKNTDILIRLRVKRIGYGGNNSGQQSFSSSSYQQTGNMHGHGHNYNSQQQQQQQQQQMPHDYYNNYNNNNNNHHQGADDIYVTVVDAKGLKKEDFFSKSDPYVIIKCGDNTKKTKTSSGSNPQWNETFHFHTAKQNALEIQIMDADVFKDDPMGKGSVSFNQLSSAYGQEQDINVPLTQKGADFGTLHLRIRRGAEAVNRSS